MLVLFGMRIIIERFQFIFYYVVYSFPDNEWGLPLAIAANLHLPYRIKIGLENFRDLHNIDDVDRRKYFIK